MTTIISNSNDGDLEAAVPNRWSFWIDRGGTFTDVLGRSPEGEITSLKLLSVSPLYEDAAVEAMRRMLETPAGAPFPAERVEAIKMGATVATNALLERTGAKTLLVTTDGFADALLIGDQARPDLFALDIVKPKPLFAGVMEACERMAAEGQVCAALDGKALRPLLEKARTDGFQAVAIAFLHADLNPAHERAAAEIARQAGFDTVALSSEVSPLPRFIPRAETAVVDAYLTPVLRLYVDKVSAAVNGAPLYFMTSAGGLVKAEAFRGKDAVVSGPAGGVVGVGLTAKEAAQGGGWKPALGFDMGGTSTDVCRWAGALERRDTATIGGSKIRVPMLDVETVAAGGGSILRFDGLRARAGPQSAGARPGPAAYGLGGPATVTDAQIVLGRLDPRAFPAVFGPNGDQPLDAAASRARLSALAAEMGAASPEAAAEGFIAVAVEETAQAVRRISTERGFDPRTHALVAFGGAAGQIACWVAEALGVSEILCPQYASLLCAWGIGQAAVTSLRQAGLEASLNEDGLARAAALAEQLAREAADDLAAQGAGAGEPTIRYSLRYDGSDAELPVAPGAEADVRAAFEEAHRRLFGFIEPDRPILVARVEAEAVALSTAHPGDGQDPGDRSATRDAKSAAHREIEKPDDPGLGVGSRRPSGRRDERIDTFSVGAIHSAPIVVAAALTTLNGPALIVRGDTQIALAPGWSAAAEPNGLIRLARLHAPSEAAFDAAPACADPVTLELFNRRFMGVAEAMGAALERTAQSVNIKERLDFSCALFDAEGGLVANAPHMPVHLGSMGASVRAVRDRHPVLKPGDAFALNNPYAGGTHLPDITVVMPVFLAREEAPSFYVAARGHHADVGGVQPGSMPPFSTTIAEEGVMLDALPIMRGGAFLDVEARAALMTGAHPARAPDRNIADLKAQIAACQAGAASVGDMIARHGARTVAAYMRFVQDNAEAAVRRAIGTLKDGSARVPLDGGGEIVVRITVDAAAGEAVVDFTGSSAVLPSNFNAPTAVVHAAVLYVFRTLIDDDIPLNAGCLAPLKIIVPERSMLAPVSPAAVVAGNVETSQHIVDALYQALGVLANSAGSMSNFTFGDEARQYYETLCGGAGASARAPGASAVQTHMTNSRLTDPEILERRFPVRVERFGIRRGSGGGGGRKGGEGLVRRIRFLEPMQGALLSTRREHPPRGIEGGGDAFGGRQSLIDADGHAKALPGCFSIDVKAGEAIEIETPGGGGFGDPSSPTPADVQD
jgi:5-oxoprolinase (ATP-hydrolysing)